MKQLIKLLALYPVLCVLLLIVACKPDSAQTESAKKPATEEQQENPVSTPEKTLAEYYNHLAKYDINKVKNLLYDPFTEYHLPQPIIINTYSVDEKKVLTQQEANAIGLTPPLQAGDVQLIVTELRNGKPQEYLYWFREKKEQWRIFGWALKNAYVEVEDDP
ncbi:hypothetical protein C7N43_06215 [Sphingobacteriales bacterium UPWRP_1]|nr:hypothetical protein BVG80_11895 [Sphingobacteriales bacterium TSM_CSM]PSJ77926.1 hypothetical protein C7N43_06215 [Sphingobacteriales bacterium UPWRP_1]